MRTAHRRVGSERGAFEQGGAHPGSFSDQLDTSKEVWAKVSSQLRNRIEARFSPEELDTIDRFILLASQSAVFDHLRR